MLNAKAFGITQGQVAVRLDVGFNHPRYELLLNRLDTSRYAVEHLYKILNSLSGGATPLRADSRLYAESGVRFLRILNVADGEVNVDDIKYITEEVHNGELARSQLSAGDVLMTITGRVGSAAVVEEKELPANINQHLVRLRIDTALCSPRFLVEWLNCPLGLELSNRAVSGGTRIALDYDAIRNIPLPLPEPQVQKDLVAAMAKARAERQVKLAQGDALLAGLDAFLLDALGLTPPPEDTRRVFAVRHHSAPGRFDPHFHAPEFARIQEMLSHTPCEPLGDFTAFLKETWKPQDHDEPTFRYIEISTVNPKTGEASWSELLTKEAPSRARMRVRPEDIIVSLTRPHHGSIAYLGKEFEGSIASTGFAVIREVEAHVRRDYLWCVLRAQFCLRQMLQRASGGNYPAITELELANITVPVPEPRVQASVAVEAEQRSKEAAMLRAEAESGWQAAKRWFEEQLLERDTP